MAIFRYPGSKSKIKDKILPKIKEGLYSFDSDVEYREPFFGGGSIGLELFPGPVNNLFVKNFKSFWINDLDYGVANFWDAVINDHERLKDLIRSFSPTVESFYEIKDKLLYGTETDKTLIGFYKLVIHRISYSGLGIKAGGPLGGKKQESEYNVDCRWTPPYICKNIDSYNKLFSSQETKCTCLDFSELLGCGSCVVYLDPPYYIKGNDLYQYSFSDEDHIRLAKYLKKFSSPWILSYDYCDFVLDLYSGWSKIDDIGFVNYSINTHRTKKELIISNF